MGKGSCSGRGISPLTALAVGDGVDADGGAGSAAEASGGWPLLASGGDGDGEMSGSGGVLGPDAGRLLGAAGVPEPVVVLILR